MSAPTDPTTLLTYLNGTYCIERPISAATLQQMAIAVRHFDRWHGCPVRLADINCDFVNRFLADSSGQRADKTLWNWRTTILCIWRLAWERGDMDLRPDHIRRIKVGTRIPDAWTLSQLNAMVAAAGRAPGTYPNGIEIAAFWSTFVRAGYDTALRLSDLLGIRFDQIGPDGQISLVQRKSGLPISVWLSAPTVEAIRHTRPPIRPLVFAWPYRRRAIWEHWRKYVLQPAGLPTGRREGPQKLRRSSASHLEASAPGNVMRHLGHRTRGLAERHYIDPRVAVRRHPLPPQLVG